MIGTVMLVSLAALDANVQPIGMLALLQEGCGQSSCMAAELREAFALVGQHACTCSDQVTKVRGCQQLIQRELLHW